MWGYPGYKHDYDSSSKIMQVSPVLPETFQDRRIRVYVKNTSQKNIEAAKV